MLPTLAQVCSLASPFETDVADYAAGDCRSLEVYLTKLEQYLDGHNASDVKQLLAEHEMSMPVASFQGGLLDSQGERRAQHWEHFAARLDLCRQLSIPTLVVAADVAGPLTQQDLDRVTASLSQAAEQAGRHGVRLALEFQASAAFCNNLQTAAAVVAETASPYLGICLDAFHFFTGPSKTEDLGLLTCENLFHVQLCDLAGRPRELASDADRILPGDGDLPLELLLSRLREINYTGCVSVELMNPQLFQVPARQFGEIAVSALRRLL
jgi:4-hydroxyphenylpyruvate dioxygenase